MGVDFLSQEEVDALLKGVTGEHQVEVLKTVKLCNQIWFDVILSSEAKEFLVSNCNETSYAALSGINRVLVDEESLLILQLKFT